MMKKFTFLLLFFTYLSQGQAPEKPTSTEIYEKVQKLNFLGKVLYIAAHPDDENTKLISYFSNYYHANTAYLSLTRGDGGQNLIGPELREKLGAIRTQELLAARRIDGGTQFFTRANDFGYSKEPNETFAIWNKNEVLSDVVQIIENFQPDIIVNRFNHRTPGTTHGHHTASAMLSLEAFDLVKIKPKRLFFNTSWWFYGSEENFAKADKSKLLSINVNVFYPLKGKSNNEIAALSRSQHKCQGFGTTGSRGEELEYLEIIKGNLPSKDNLFEGIDTSWNRIKGGNEIGKILNKIEQNFDFKNPSVHLPDLIKAYKLIQNLEESHWKTSKKEEIKSIIEACAGLYLEAVSSVENATPKSTIDIKIEVLNRSEVSVNLNKIKILNSTSENINKVLVDNEKLIHNLSYTLPENVAYSNLFWLQEKQQNGLYTISDTTLRNLPEIKNQFPIEFELEILGERLTFIKNLVYKTNEPDNGETYIPFTIVPKFSIQFASNVTIFNANQTKKIEVKVQAFEDNAKGNLSLCYPNDWVVHPKSIPVAITNKNESKSYIFEVTAPQTESSSVITAMIKSDQQEYNKTLTTISYSHIPKQTILENAEAKVVNLNIKTSGKNIGYLMGAGDEVGNYLENLNYNITYLKPADLVLENLQQFDAIILGIRAFNVVDELKFKNKVLFDYVANGGNLIVQYNTAHNLVTKEIAPYELTISRNRVTNENSEVQFLNPKLNVLNYPNIITKSDFEGWVQERGLYFPDKWSKEFIPVFGMNDTGEEQLNSSLLLAKYGKGNYIYTGLSFFRELPEGVSGAFKLLANLIALE